MSYTATRFAPVVRFNQSLDEHLDEMGYLYDGREVHDLVSMDYEDRQVHQSDIRRIADMEEKEFFQYIASLSRGARYIAGRIWHRCFGKWNKEDAIAAIDLKQLARDWAAKKELVSFLGGIAQEELNNLSLAGNGYAKLMSIDIRFAWQAKRFIELYKELCNPQRPWGSCYQPNHQKVKAIALTPNFNRLPLWVKKVLIESESPQCIQTKRVGDIWKLIPAAKAWKVAPDLPKGIALRVGEMPVWKRLAAKVAWEQLCYQSSFYTWGELSEYSRNGGYEVREKPNRGEVVKSFWYNFDELCRQGMDAVLVAAGDLPRAIAIKNKKLSPLQGKALSLLLPEVAGEEKPVTLLQGFKPSVFFSQLDGIISQELSSFKEIKDSITGEWVWKAFFAGSIVFAKELPRWLQKQASLGIGEHDALYWLPIAPVRKLEGLSRWLFKFGDRSITELEIVSKRWQHLSADERSLSYRELLNLCRSQVYVGCNSPEFAQEAGQWGVSQNNYPNWEARFITSLETPMSFPTDKVWESGGIIGKFLKRSDARGLFLGQHTNCCQHPDGVGAQCAWYGQESPNSGFFVWESKGEIVAQSWCWVSDDGGLCFDNVEAKGLGDRADAVKEVLSLAAAELSAKFHTITLGTGLSDLSTHDWESCKSQMSPRDYSGYTDSQSQVLLAQSSPRGFSPVADFAHNPSLPKQKVFNSAAWVRGALVQDLDECEAIALECYPDGWQFVSADENSYGVVLQSSEGILGYAVMNLKHKRIDDIAVSPQHRKHSMLLVNEVVKVCARQGGTWECEARASTSYRLLKLLHRRGKIQIISESLTENMGDEPMYKIRFTYVGRVAVRSTGSFNVSTASGLVQGLSHKYCKSIHKKDGYSYGY